MLNIWGYALKSFMQSSINICMYNVHIRILYIFRVVWQQIRASVFSQRSILLLHMQRKSEEKERSSAHIERVLVVRSTHSLSRSRQSLRYSSSGIARASYISPGTSHTHSLYLVQLSLSLSGSVNLFALFLWQRKSEKEREERESSYSRPLRVSVARSPTTPVPCRVPQGMFLSI